MLKKPDWKKNRIKVKAVSRLTTNANGDEKIRRVKNKKETDLRKMRNDAAGTGDIFSDPQKYF